MNTTKIKIAIRENKIVRTVALPFATLKRWMDRQEYVKSEDSKYLSSIKNSRKGETCFVIGNGPSLQPKDLDIIDYFGIDSFGSNRIYYIFDRTNWRPTYYVSMDIYGLSENANSVIAKGNYSKFLNYKAKKFVNAKNDSVHYIFSYGKFKVDPYVMESSELSDDCADHVSKTATVTANAIELAIYMGYSNIYLLGVDNNYARKRLGDGEIIEDKSMKTSYFEGMKDGQGNPGDGFSVQTVDFMNEAYEVCKRFAEKHGVKIYNATRGGKLETYERVSFDEVMRTIGSNS